MTPEQKLKALAYYVAVAISYGPNLPKYKMPFDEFLPVFESAQITNNINPLTLDYWTF